MSENSIFLLVMMEILNLITLWHHRLPYLIGYATALKFNKGTEDAVIHILRVPLLASKPCYLKSRLNAGKVAKFNAYLKNKLSYFRYLQ